MSIKSNLKATLRNLLGASSAILEVSSELVADASQITVSGIRQVKPVGKELLQSPLSAYEGYLVEDGMTEAKAHAKAFAVLDKDLASAIQGGAKAIGSYTSKALEGWDDEEVIAIAKK